ncbi:hypothetical protein EV175_000163 [Coemansia sp. RSA 1933]|nr:hypothetical protein EV175_000163 [Coemansia sp. RSA 1933]
MYERVCSRAADLLQGDTSAINAFKANPALAFSQLSRNAPTGSNTNSKGRTTKQQTAGDGSAPSSGASTPVGGGGAGLDQIDAELATQLKRLGKSDSKTKMRALAAIQEYVDGQTWEAGGGLQTMLLAWPALFRRHIFDSDRRVRAAVAGVHASLVAKSGKQLAAQLKALIGPWVAAFFDPHREAARCARQAFESAFPESKRSDVFVYCAAELVEFASDCIENQTPETLSDPRFADADEMQAKHEHVVGAAFGVLALAIEEVPADKQCERQTDFDTLFGSGQMQRYAGSASPYVRRSMYRLVRAVMLKNPDLAKASYRSLARGLLSNCFGDSDPNAHGDMWDAVLLLTKTYPQAWAEIEAESKAASSSRDGRKKSPVDGLFGFLRMRCRLAPTVSYPSILALLANLPASILDAPSFQPGFHKALWQGVTGQPDGSASAEPVDADGGFSRSSYQESVALVSAISECFSFLWTRKLKESGNAASCAAVGKEVAKETDRLWHFYLQYPQFAHEMAVPIVRLYKKLEALADKYDPSMLDRVWAQASWFALKRISGDSIYPIVYLTAQIAHLDPQTHRGLAESANKLLVAFCQLAAQSQDTQTVQSLVHVLAQLAPEVVFQDQYAADLEARLKSAGSVDDSVALVLSRAQHIATGGNVSEAVAAIDSFVAETVGVGTADDDAFRTMVALLSALPNSRVAKNPRWTECARLDALDSVLMRSRPPIAENLDVDSNQGGDIAAPPPSFVRMGCQTLLLYFSGTEIVSAEAIDSMFGWMEQLFTVVLHTQWKHDSGGRKGWADAVHEVLASWTVLARDLAGGPRFVRYWLRRSGRHAGSALGLLFDYAVTPTEDTEAAMREQAQQAWAATEAQLERLHLGHELAVALGDSIGSSVGALDSSKDPVHLARLAGSVYTRVCPQDNAKALRLLAAGWLLDAGAWHAAIKADASGHGADVDGFLAAAANACSAGLRQAVEDYAAPGHTKSFHTLAHWMASASAVVHLGQTNENQSKRYDAFGLTRFARRAIFSVEFLQQQVGGGSDGGGLAVLAGVDAQMLGELVLNLTLAYVLLRESLLLAASYSGPASDPSSVSEDNEAASLGDNGPSIVRIDGDDPSAPARASAAANAIQECVSDLLGLLAVHESSLNEKSEASVSAPRDPSRWLSVLIERATASAADDPSTDKSFWGQLAGECVARSRASVASPWALVLGTLAQWCHWAQPLGSSDLEAVVAGPLSHRLDQSTGDTSELGMLTSIVRAVSLRQLCLRSPGMQGALLAVLGRLDGAIEQDADSAAGRLRIVAQLELLAELLPVQSASLDAATSTPKAIRVLLAAGKTANALPSLATAVPMALATLAAMERVARCVPVIEDTDAVALGRLCLGWCALEVGSGKARGTQLASAASTGDAVLVAGARAVCALAQMAERLVDGSDRVIGPTMHRLAGELVARSVLSERPVADGVHAVTRLVKSGYYATPPALDALYPVLTSASPRLAVELVQLAVAAPDLATHVGPHVDVLVRLVSLSAKALGDLADPGKVAETVRTDEYVRSAAVRQLASMLLLVRCAHALAAADVQRFDQLSEALSGGQVLDAAMPWVCGLLGLDGDRRRAAFPRVWDVAADMDWDTLADELVRNPSGAHVLALVAYHVVYGVAWALPSTMRSWWAGLPQAQRATSAQIEQFVTRHVSPLVVQRELARIKHATEEEGGGVLAQTLDEYDDASVRVGASQVTLQYVVDDSTLEMAVRLPAAYPLAPPLVESVRRVAVSEKRWRAWLVATQALLARNRHADAVCVQLVGNVGAHFAGVEDCAICYSAVGSLDNSLPNRQCRTCKNKFHRMCLFKWFSTSSQSTCPLCRNLF